jgi:uncharacterized lipoprotein YmbA
MRPRTARSLAGAFLLLAGCTEATEPTRHYIIDAAEQRGVVRQVSAQEGPIVAIAPVNMPEYLNQNGIVTRNSRNEVTRSELNQWAGPLSEEIARALAENLTVMLPTDRVTLNASRRSVPVDYTIDVEIVQFERDAASNAVNLIARWTVFRGDERNVVSMRRSRYSKPVAGPDYSDTVAAMSDAVAALSDEIATAIAQARSGRGTGRFAANPPSSKTASGDATRRRR